MLKLPSKHLKITAITPDLNSQFVHRLGGFSFDGIAYDSSGLLDRQIFVEYESSPGKVCQEYLFYECFVQFSKDGNSIMFFINFPDSIQHVVESMEDDATITALKSSRLSTKQTIYHDEGLLAPSKLKFSESYVVGYFKKAEAIDAYDNEHFAYVLSEALVLIIEKTRENLKEKEPPSETESETNNQEQ